MLDAQSCDPKVVLWNGLALLPQSEAQFGVDLGSGDRDVQDRAASDQRFNLGEVLGRLPRIEGPYRSSPTTGAGRRCSLARESSRASAFAARTSIATLVSSATRSPLPGVDALELTIDDLPELLSVLRRERARNLGKGRRLQLDVHGQRDLVMLDQTLGTSERPKYAVLEDGGYGLAHVHNPSRSRIASPESDGALVNLGRLLIGASWVPQAPTGLCSRPRVAKTGLFSRVAEAKIEATFERHCPPSPARTHHAELSR